VSYASVYEQTHARQSCNLFISWLWTQTVIVLPTVARACDDQSTVHLDWQLGGYSSARVRNVRWINRVLLRISIWYSCQFAGFHVANWAVTLLLLLSMKILHKRMKYFHNEYSRARPSTVRSGQVRSSTVCVCRSFRNARVADQLFAFNRGSLVARCALVRNSL